MHVKAANACRRDGGFTQFTL